jgi:hypothetical protein
VRRSVEAWHRIDAAQSHALSSSLLPAELTAEAFAKAEILGTANVFAYEAVRATTSAPTFYAPAIVGGQRMVDGAIINNNPTIMALAEAALLWPGARVDLVASLGTGTMTLRPNAPSSVVAWVKTVLDLALEAHVTHKVAATLLGDRYHRFDPDGVGDVELTETRPDVIAKMLEDGRAYIHRNDARFRELARALGYSRRPAGAPAPRASVASRPAAAAAVDGPENSSASGAPRVAHAPSAALAPAPAPALAAAAAATGATN